MERDRLGSLTIKQFKIRAHDCTAIHQALHHHDNNTQLQRLMCVPQRRGKDIHSVYYSQNRNATPLTAWHHYPWGVMNRKTNYMQEIKPIQKFAARWNCSSEMTAEFATHIRTLKSISGFINCRQASVFQALAALLLCMIKHSRLWLASVCVSVATAFLKPFMCLPVCCVYVCIL